MGGQPSGWDLLPPCSLVWRGGQNYPVTSALRAPSPGWREGETARPPAPFGVWDGSSLPPGSSRLRLRAHRRQNLTWCGNCGWVAAIGTSCHETSGSLSLDFWGPHRYPHASCPLPSSSCPVLLGPLPGHTCYSLKHLTSRD